MDLRELFDNVDGRLAFQPDATPRVIAHELKVRIKDIEQAVREVEGVSFHEYVQNKKLVHALRMIEKGIWSDKNENVTGRRANPRLTISGAVVRFLVRGRGIQKAHFSQPYPVLDLGRGGIAFLADRPAKPDNQISLLLSIAKDEKDLRVEGKIVYSTPVGGTGYGYRIGVRFQPFAAKKGFNPPEVEQVLDATRKPIETSQHRQVSVCNEYDQQIQRHCQLNHRGDEI